MTLSLSDSKRWKKNVDVFQSESIGDCQNIVGYLGISFFNICIESLICLGSCIATDPRGGGSESAAFQGAE